MFFPPPPPSQDLPLLVDATRVALPGVVTTCGGVDKQWIVEVNGGGLALDDFNGDGHLDLLVVDGSTVERVRDGKPGLPPRLFLGDGVGRFAPAPQEWALPAGRWGMGVAAGDLNGDGWLDLVLTEWGPDRVLLGTGEGFNEVASLPGDGWSSSAVLFDANGDDVLDLFVTGYLEFDPARVPSKDAGDARWKGHPVVSGPEGFTPIADRFYIGRGDGSFTNVPLPTHSAGFGLGVTILDVEGDGDLDVFVANDSTPNHLWLGDGEGRFVEGGFAAGLAHDANGREQACMGIASGDLDGDGRPDLFVTNFSGESNALYRASKLSGRFRESALRFGVEGPSLRALGWGTGAGDLDLDGDLDLFVLNGHVYPEADRPGTDTSYAQVDQLYLRRGRGFRVEALDAGHARCSRAGVLGDLDHDGDLDLVALSVEGPVRVFHGTAADGGGGRGVVIDLVGSGAGRGHGARVEVHANGMTWVRAATTAGGFQSSGPVQVHFGVGDAARLERVIVRWPSGREQVLADVPVTPRLRVEEPR